MKTSTKWRIAFLGVTGVAIAMELKAALDKDKRTDPWTDMIVRHVPAEVTGAAISGLAGWLVLHFGVRYLKKERTGTW